MGKASGALAEFVGGALAGVALGYVAAIVLAPREGTEMRAQVRDTAESLRQAPGQVVDTVQARVQFAVETGRRAAAEAREEMESAAGLRSGEPTIDRPPPSSAI